MQLGPEILLGDGKSSQSWINQNLDVKTFLNLPPAGKGCAGENICTKEIHREAKALKWKTIISNHQEIELAHTAGD